MDILLVLVILGFALVFFASEWLRVDITAMIVLVTITILGLIDYQQAFAGFANPAVITVLGMFVLGGSLVRTGVAAWIGQWMLRIAGSGEKRLLLVIMLTVGLMSAFMNNIAAVAILAPAVSGLARQFGIPPTKFLMPLAFASLLGGLTTVIGTPPNILVSMVLVDHGYEAFGMFDYTPTGLAVLAAGVVFILLIGHRLLPSRGTRPDLADKYEVDQYFSEILVPPDSPLVGITLNDAGFGREYGVTVLMVLRGNEKITAHGWTTLQPNDVLLVEASVDDLLDIKTSRGLEILADATLEDLRPSWLELTEATLAPRSRFIGRSIKQLDFRRRYGLNVIAIRRHERTLTDRIGDIRLSFGDVLLLQGTHERTEALRETGEFLFLEPIDNPVPRTDKALIAIGVMFFTVSMAAFDILHVSVAAITGAVLMILSGCLSIDEAYQSIEWRAVVLIGAMLPMGTAMEVTGTAAFLAGQMVGVLGDLGPVYLMGGLYFLTMIITQVMSNAAAAVLLAPLAISLAGQTGVAPHPYMMAIAISASSAFITPIGHQASVLVYAVGNYRFTDFTKMGLPLALLIFFVSMMVIPRVWPF